MHKRVYLLFAVLLVTGCAKTSVPQVPINGNPNDASRVIASALRDAPRPERTPETDPNLTRFGPKIGQPRKLLSRLNSHYSFCPKDRFVVYQDGPTIFALPTDQADGKPLEIIRLDHSPWEVLVLNQDLDLLIAEIIPSNSVDDPVRIWWVHGKRKEKKLLRGPEKHLKLAEAPVSPDHRYVALEQWQDSGKEPTKLLYILDLESGKAKVFEAKNMNLSIVGWKTTEAGLRAVAVTKRWRVGEKEFSGLFLADPLTGKLEHQENEDARIDIDNRLSPDGKHRVRVGRDDLVVTNVADGKQRRLVFHEDDHRFVGDDCVEWVSPRYLKFNGPRLALIDVTTMKMCFPVSADGKKFGSPYYKFSSDFRWVLYQGEGSDGEGLFLAPVEMPKQE